jgi:hypothetical protein
MPTTLPLPHFAFSRCRCRRPSFPSYEDDALPNDDTLPHDDALPHDRTTLSLTTGRRALPNHDGTALSLTTGRRSPSRWDDALSLTTGRRSPSRRDDALSLTTGRRALPHDGMTRSPSWQRQRGTSSSSAMMTERRKEALPRRCSPSLRRSDTTKGRSPSSAANTKSCSSRRRGQEEAHRHQGSGRTDWHQP